MLECQQGNVSMLACNVSINFVKKKRTNSETAVIHLPDILSLIKKCLTNRNLVLNEMSESVNVSATIKLSNVSPDIAPHTSLLH